MYHSEASPNAHQSVNVHLGIGEVGHGVEVSGDELATWVFVDAQLRILDLVVVDGPVESDNHSWMTHDQQ